MGCSEPKYDPNTLNLHIDTDPTTLDPAMMTDVRSGRLSALLFDTLVRFDENLELQPGLARAWNIVDNGMTYTFYLRKGVLFSNGETLSAADVKYSFERLIHRKTASPRSWIFSNIQGFDEFKSSNDAELTGIQILDSHTLSIKLKKPFSPFLALLTMPNASILSKKSLLKNELSGTGPFVLDHWKRDYEILLKSNPNYYDGSPQINQIRFRMIKETLFVSSEFRRGRLDVIEIPNTEIPLYRRDPKWKDQILTQNNLSLYYWGFNLRRVPFNTKEFRQAISNLINKDILIKTIRKDRALPVIGPIPPGLPGYDPNLPKQDFNSSHASKIIAKYRTLLPRTLTLLQSTNEETLELSEALQAQLNQAGINVKIIEQEWSAFKNSLLQGDFDTFLVSWWADYPEGENFLYPLFHSSNFGSGGNYTHFQNAEIDELIERSQKTTSSQEKLNLYHEIQKRIIEECPMVFLYSSRSLLIKQPWISNFKSHPLYNGNKLTRVVKNNEALKNPN
jgi:peptide/nickel transport system substrate-binding protein/oligopeptide transport system substrate-binding protein